MRNFDSVLDRFVAHNRLKKIFSCRIDPNECEGTPIFTDFMFFQRGDTSVIIAILPDGSFLSYKKWK